MRVNRAVADESTKLSLTRSARCQRQAAGKNISPYRIVAPRNQPIRIRRSVSSNTAAGMRRNTKNNAATVTATQISFHFTGIHFGAEVFEAEVSSVKMVGCITG